MGDRKAQIRHTEALKEELNAIVKRMDSVQDKYIDGDIDKATYNRLMERYSHEAESLKQRIELAENKNSAKVEPKMGYAISLIDNIDRFILDAPVSLKIKLLGSMFPEKIEFDGKNIEPKTTTRCLILYISKPMSCAVVIKKTERVFQLSPFQYPEPILFTENIRNQQKQKELKYNILQRRCFLLVSLRCTIFSRLVHL